MGGDEDPAPLPSKEAGWREPPDATDRRGGPESKPLPSKEAACREPLDATDKEGGESGTSRAGYGPVAGIVAGDV